jgi:hypothetical protein
MRWTLFAAALLLAAAPAGAGVRLELRARRRPGRQANLPLRGVIDGPRLAAELARRDGKPPTRRIVFRSSETCLAGRPQAADLLPGRSEERGADRLAGVGLRQGIDQGSAR